MLKYLLKDGSSVTDRYKSKLSPELLKILPFALAKINSDQRNFLTEEVDMERIIGNSICVSTSEEDEIIYAKRIGVERLTRFVKGRQAEPTRFLTVTLIKKNAANYIIINAFFGNKAEPEPFDEKSILTGEEKLRSIKFWNEHALLWEAFEKQPDTETTVCPWDKVNMININESSY